MEEVPSMIPVGNGMEDLIQMVTASTVQRVTSTSTTMVDIMATTRSTTRITTSTTVARSRHTPMEATAGTRNNPTATTRVMAGSTVTRRVIMEVTNAASTDTRKIHTGAHPTTLAAGSKLMVTIKPSKNYMLYHYLYFLVP